MIGFKTTCMLPKCILDLIELFKNAIWFEKNIFYK